MVSHDVRGAVEQADHILHLGNRQLFFGTTAAYLQTDIGKRFTGGRAPCALILSLLLQTHIIWRSSIASPDSFGRNGSAAVRLE